MILKIIVSRNMLFHIALNNRLTCNTAVGAYPRSSILKVEGIRLNNPNLCSNCVREYSKKLKEKKK